MNGVVIEDEKDGEFENELVQIMAWGPEKEKAMMCNLIQINVEENATSDDDEEVVINKITEMSV